MTKIKILILTVIVFAISLNAFAAIPVVTGDESEPPRVVITEGDRMRMETDFSSYVKFFFIGYEFDHKEKFKEVSLLFEPVGMIDWFNNYIKAVQKNNDAKKAAIYYLNQSLKRFNDFLSQSQENRDRVAEVFNTRLRKEWEEKQREKHEEKRVKELIGNRELKFVGFNLGFGTHPGRRYDLSSGVGYWYFNTNITKSFNYGISINANFSFQGKSLSNTYSYTNTADKCGYLNLNGNFLLKFGKFNSYIWGLGFDVSVKLTKAEHYTFKDYYYGLRFENGFLYLKNNLSWGLYFTIYVKLLFYEKTDQLVSESDTGMSFALGFQATFLLNLTGK